MKKRGVMRGDHSILTLEDLSISFGGLKAVDNCSFEMKKGEIFSLIGPNGAGKTTIFNIINGIYKPDQGKVLLEGVNLIALKPHQIAKQGVARTFQNIDLFDQMTVMENLLVGHHMNLKAGLLVSFFLVGKTRQEERHAFDFGEEILEFLGLLHYRDDLVTDLPFGIQKKIELGRALALKPKLMLLDEPAGGLNPMETKDLMKLIQTIRDSMGISILLVEHDMRVVMGLSERICVLHFGQRIAEGSPEEIQKDLTVIEAYLGTQKTYA